MKLLVMYYNAHDLFLHPRIAGELRMPLKKKKKKGDQGMFHIYYLI